MRSLFSSPLLQVKTITSLSLAALAEAASPYGIESFDDVLEPLWRGIRSLRGKVLAAFLKCIGFIIPLMDAEHAFYYTREVMVVLKREFQTPDEEMKKIVLKVGARCSGEGGWRATHVGVQNPSASCVHSCSPDAGCGVCGLDGHMDVHVLMIPAGLAILNCCTRKVGTNLLHPPCWLVYAADRLCSSVLALRVLSQTTSRLRCCRSSSAASGSAAWHWTGATTGHWWRPLWL